MTIHAPTHYQFIIASCQKELNLRLHYLHIIFTFGRTGGVCRTLGSQCVRPDFTKLFSGIYLLLHMPGTVSVNNVI